jgi:hypothetical protein
MNELIEEMDELVNWLSDNNKSHNIVKISQCLNKLSILMVSLSSHVSDLYRAQNEAEDDYKIALGTKFGELKATKLSVDQAKAQAEVELRDSRKEATEYKNGYKRLSGYQDSVERVMDVYRQYISTLKDDRKFSVNADQT